MDTLILAKYAEQLQLIGNGGTVTPAKATATLNSSDGKIRTATVTTHGSGYKVGDVLTVVQTGGSGGQVTVTKTGTSGSLVTVGISAMGSGYSSIGTATVGGGVGGGVNGVVTLTVGNGIATVLTTGTGNSPGSGYMSAIVTTNLAPGDVPAVLTPTISSGSITTIAVNDGGNFSTAPTITITAGPPLNGTDLITALKKYDDSVQNARLIEVLKQANHQLVIDIDESVINDAITTGLGGSLP